MENQSIIFNKDMSEHRESIERQLLTDTTKNKSVLHCPKCGIGGNGTSNGDRYVNGKLQEIYISMSCPNCQHQWKAEWDLAIKQGK